MGVLADKIEQFILTQLLEDKAITLRRNELATMLDCAPSQISYVLSTRFSNDRGFIVESRRGLGGSITITRIVEPTHQAARKPAVTIQNIDKVLFNHLEKGTITKREAAMLHEAFQILIESVPPEELRKVTNRFYERVMALTKEG